MEPYLLIRVGRRRDLVDSTTGPRRRDFKRQNSYSKACETTRLATFEGIEIRGALNQVHSNLLSQIPTPTINAASVLSDLRIHSDSHLLFPTHTIGGGIGAGFFGIEETNDGSRTAPNDQMDQVVVGIGRQFA